MLCGKLPIRIKNTAQIAEHRPLYGKRKIVPAACIGGRAHIVTGNIHTAHHRLRAVGNGDFAVIAQICAAPKGQVHHRHEKSVSAARGHKSRERPF